MLKFVALTYALILCSQISRKIKDRGQAAIRTPNDKRELEVITWK